MRKLIVFVFALALGSRLIAEDPSIRRKAYIEKQRILVTKLIALLSDMKELRVEYDATGMSGTFVEQDFIDTGNNHITPAQFTSVIVSEDAITSLLTAGGNAHYTNLYRIVR